MRSLKKIFGIPIMLFLLVCITVAFTACNLNGIIGNGSNTGGGNTDAGNTDGGNNDDGNNDGGNTDGGNTDGDSSVLTEPCVLNSESAQISAEKTDGTLTLTLTDTSGSSALTVRAPVDESWDTVKITQGNDTNYAKVYTKNGTSIVDFSMKPNAENAVITPALTTDEEKLESDFGMTLTNGIKIDTNYYPGFVRKSLTFTIDDGDIKNDTTFINIVRPAGIKGTFNICRTTDAATAAYRALYYGFEVANHHQLHALPFRETANYHTGKSFESILKDESYGSVADTNYAYKTSIEGLYYINYHYYSAAYVGKTSWHAMASDATYFKYAKITKDNIESVFGEGSVAGFAYPHGVLTDTVKQYLKDMGYLYARKTGNLGDTTGFALPSDRFAWTYNANVSTMLTEMAKYDALSDDGNLKFFAFGVHAADFVGHWDVLEEFASLYGNRPEDFWYASNRDIFEYEDAIKSLRISTDKIENPSDVAVFVTVNGEKVIIPANSVYYLDGQVKLLVTFNSDNGSALRTREFEIGSTVNVPANPIKKGFTFLGWYAGERKWDFNDTLTEGMTLTAKYEAPPFEAPTAEVLPVKGGAGGIVSIIHDDGRSESGYILDSLYHKYSLVGDVAMLTTNVYNQSSGTPKAEYNNWKNIIDTGRWGVISHSLTHTWWGNVTKDSSGNNIGWEEDDAKMYDEVAKSQQILRNLFPGQRVLTFAYPGFGAESKGLTKEQTFDILFSKKARELISEYYISARYAGENAPAYVTKDSDWYFLDGFFLFPSNINGTGSNSLRNRLESAASSGRIHMLSLHAVSNELASGETASGAYTISAEDMETACKLISSYVEDGRIWNAHYEEAVLYVREAQNATVTVTGDESSLRVVLTDTMDNDIYNYPLTVRIGVPAAWEAAKVIQGESVSYSVVKYINGKCFIDTDIVPDGGEATVTPIAKDDIPYTPVKAPVPPASKDSPTTPAPTLPTLSLTQNFNTELGVIGYDTSRATVETVLRDGSATDKVLKINKFATGSTAPTIQAATTVSNASEFTFEFDINIESANDTLLAQIFFNTSIAKSPIDFTISKSGSGYRFNVLNTYSGGSTSEFGTTAKILSFGKYYHVKLHVSIGTADTFLATLYIGDELIGTTNVFLNPDKVSGYQPSKEVNGVLIACQSSALFSAYIDNISLGKIIL